MRKLSVFLVAAVLNLNLIGQGRKSAPADKKTGKGEAKFIATATNEAVLRAEKLYNRKGIGAIRESILILEKELSAGREIGPDGLATLSQGYSFLTYRDSRTDQADMEYVSKADSYLNSAFKSEAGNFKVFRAKGHELLMLGKYEEASRALAEAIELNPEDSETWYLLACTSPGDFAEPDSVAGRRLKQSLVLNPGNLWALEDLMMRHLAREEYAQAAEVFAKMRETNPGHENLLLAEGILLIHIPDARGQRRRNTELGLEKIKAYTEAVPIDNVSAQLAAMVNSAIEP